MIVDAHCHLWRLSRGDYGWLTPDLTALYRDYEIADLLAQMASAGVEGAVLVQAAETVAETDFLLSLAAETPRVLGVVGWADFAQPETAEAIPGLAARPGLLGLRPMLQDLADDDFILRPAADAALSAMATHGLRFEALVRPRHLRRLLTVRERHPGLTLILDHGGKPDIAGSAWEPWASDIRRLAADGRTLCKLSGLVTEAAPGWTADSLRPYADLLIEAFGPQRLMWGSDWPVVRLAQTDYAPWLETARGLLAGLGRGDREDILGGVARRVYGRARTSRMGG
jgi:L-fuconolactonase